MPAAVMTRRARVRPRPLKRPTHEGHGTITRVSTLDVAFLGNRKNLVSIGTPGAACRGKALQVLIESHIGVAPNRPLPAYNHAGRGSVAALAAAAPAR